VKEHCIETITDACLIALPGDLLYLYFAGVWYDPNPVILWAELVILPLISLFGIFRVWRYLRRKNSTHST